MQRLGALIQAMSEAAHYRLTGYPGSLCARAAWRRDPFWRAFRRVLDTVHTEPDHCEASFWRCYCDWWRE